MVSFGFYIFQANLRNTVRNSPADMTLLPRNVAAITDSFYCVTLVLRCATVSRQYE
jgi:hypothetical protein